MGTTTPGALPYPEPTDPVAAGAANFRSLAEAVDPLLVHRFASVAARDAAWPAATAGAGAMSVTTDTGTVWEVVGAAWVAIAGPVAWQTPVLQNGWVVYGAGFQVPRYRKIGDVVEIEGMVKSGAASSAVFTLPVGFRPALAQQFPNTSNAQPGSLNILSDGSVQANSPSNASFHLIARFSVTP